MGKKRVRELLREDGTRIDLGLLTLLFVFFALLFFKPWIIGDGLGYYSTLRSFALDGDVDFANEYAHLQTLDQGWVFDPQEKTATGLSPNVWPVGNAILWSPFFYAAHALESFGGEAADGYSQRYYDFVTFGTLVYSLATLILVYFFLRRFVAGAIAIASTIMIFVCSTLFYYTYHDPSMSHAHSAFTVTCFFYFWHATRKGRTMRQHIVLGALAGFMSLVRYQNILFAVVLAIELAGNASKGREVLRRSLVKYAASAVAAVLVFSPQMLFWKALYGQYLTKPASAVEFIWYPKHVFDVLFSSTHGLFTWTPLILLSFLGFIRLYKREKTIFPYIIIPLILQVLFVSSTSTWHGGWSYGIRMLTNCTLIFALGLSMPLEWARKRMHPGYILAVLSLFILWSLLLMTQVHHMHQIIDPAYPFSRILEDQVVKAPKLLFELVNASLFG